MSPVSDVNHVSGIHHIENGPPGAIRTHDLPLRRRLLYPAELQAGSGEGRIIHVRGLVGKSRA